MQGSVRKKGNTWYYRIDLGIIDGKRKQIERKGGETKGAAQTALRKALNEFESTGEVHIPSEITLSDMAREWFDERTKKKALGTRNDYENVIRNHIEKHKIGKMKIKVLQNKPEILQEYIDEKSKIYADSTMKSHFAVLNGSFRYATSPKKKYIKNNPMLHVERKSFDEDVDIFDIDNEKEPDVITVKEYEKIIERFSDTIYELPTQVGFHTGCREGEVCGILLDDITWFTTTATMFRRPPAGRLKRRSINPTTTPVIRREKVKRVNMYGEIHICKKMFYNNKEKCWELGPTKGKKDHTIRVGKILMDDITKALEQREIEREKCGPFWTKCFLKRVKIDGKNHAQIITAPLWEVDEQYKDLTPIEFLCSKFDGSPVTNQTLKYGNKVVKKMYDQLADKEQFPNLEKYHFHMLRHTHATLSLEGGADPKDVQERLAHTNIATTMNVYAHTTKETNKRTVEAFERAIKKDL